MEFQIKCHLGYEVSGPASFLFNVAVAENSFQRIVTEHFEVGGAERLSGNGYRRPALSPGYCSQRSSRAAIRCSGGRYP